MQGVLFFIIFILSSIPMFIIGDKENLFLLFIHLIIALITSLSLSLYRSNPFSLYKIINLFYLFFLCIAPFFQFKYGITFWGAKEFTDNEYIYTSLIVLYTLLFYNLIYYIVYKRSKCKIVKKIHVNLSESIVTENKIRRKEFLCFLILDVAILFFLLYMYNFNLSNLFVRGGDTDSESFIDLQVTTLPQSITLIITNFLRPMSVILLLAAYKLNAPKIELFILAFFTLIIAFPTSMPRFSAAAMYIPIVLSFISLLRKPNLFVFCFVMGILIIFPFLNNFRNYSSDANINIGLDFKMFLEGHFDSYAIFAHILCNNIMTYGNQILGVLFFWIPRTVWPSKPIGSGAYVADELNLNWSNISCCFFGEGYINFGFLGILLFVSFIAWFSASFDKIYWSTTLGNKKTKSFFEIIYFILLGLIFFMLRGDLMSSFAYTLGYISSILFVYYLLKFYRKYKLTFRG